MLTGYASARVNRLCETSISASPGFRRINEAPHPHAIDGERV
ncbi:hypothetical protein MYA_5173 [Burkholderia sp. KJ006]|nr:hypothetical protein MYA_5173 [Burkholderia sp. KJ006]